MSKINEYEKSLIKQFVENGYESNVLDYKIKLYDICSRTTDYKDKGDTFKAKFDVIHDCLAFLNSDIYKDKYIIMGIDDGMKKGRCKDIKGIQGKSFTYDSDLKNHLTLYIDPTPVIEVFNYDYFDVDESTNKKLVVLKIYKENLDYPYLLKKDIQKCKEYDGIKTIYKIGSSFVRDGNSIREITRKDIDNFYYRKGNRVTNYLYPYIYKSNIMNNKRFIELMDFIISKKHFEEFSRIEKGLIEKIAHIIMSFNDINENGYELSTEMENNLLCKSIAECVGDYKIFSKDLDNGINSFLIRIFTFVQKLFYLYEQDYYGLEFKSNVLNVKLKNTINCNLAYQDAKSHISELSEIFQDIKYKNGANRYNEIVKIVDLEVFDLEADNKKFPDFEARFEVSNSIIPLLIGPLYGENSYHVGARELMQNAIDACKKKHYEPDGEPPIVSFNIEYDEESKRNVSLTVEDNGVGMDGDTLKNYYFKVGESNKGDTTLGLVGRFGVGVLSGFLLGDQIEVSTKSDEDNSGYKFQLKKESYLKTKGSINNSEKLEIFSYDNQITSGTSVNIKFNDNEMINDNNIFETLKIDDWCIEDKIKLQIFRNSKIEFEVPNINDDRVVWGNIPYSKDEVKIQICDFEKTSLIDEDDFRNIKNYLKKNQGKVLYNGILLDPDYSITGINLKNVPLIKIKDMSKRQMDKNSNIIVPLNRKNIELKGAVLEVIGAYLYRKAFANLENYIKITNDKIEIRDFNFEYFDNVKLIYTKEGYGLYCNKFLKKLRENGYSELVKLHVKYGEKTSYSNLEEGRAYVIEHAYSFNKTKLADLIENHPPVHYISKNLFYEYYLGTDKIRLESLAKFLNEMSNMNVIEDANYNKKDGKNYLHRVINDNAKIILKYFDDKYNNDICLQRGYNIGKIDLNKVYVVQFRKMNSYDTNEYMNVYEDFNKIYHYIQNDSVK